jgi:hypothetical protein
MSDPIVSPRLFVAPDLFEAFVERLSTELIPLLPPYDLWEAGAAAPPDPVSAPRAEAVLTGVGEILNAGLEFGSPLCYFWRDLLGHMKPDWWRERDGMIAAGVPRMSPSDDVIGFLDAFLNRLLDFLRIFGERVGERPYRSRYAIEAAAVPIVDAASAQLDVSEESDGMWVLEGPFDQFVVLFEWATGELLVSPELVRAGSSVPQ